MGHGEEMEVSLLITNSIISVTPSQQATISFPVMFLFFMSSKLNDFHLFFTSINNTRLFFKHSSELIMWQPTNGKKKTTRDKTVRGMRKQFNYKKIQK